MTTTAGSDNQQRCSDPFTWIERIRTKLHGQRLRVTYPFRRFGRNVSIHHTCDIGRPEARGISIGDHVYLAPDVWLNVEGSASEPRIVLGNGSRIGRRSTISAKHNVWIEDDVLLAPAVLIMDHNHEYSNPDIPIHAQGTTAGGRIRIGRNSWIGYGAVISCSRGELSLGRNSVVGANSVVKSSFPDYSVIVGNPARLIKTYNPRLTQWITLVGGEQQIF